MLAPPFRHCAQVPALVQFSIVLSTLGGSTFFEHSRIGTFSPPIKPKYLEPFYWATLTALHRPVPLAMDCIWP